MASLLPAPIEGGQLMSAFARSWRCQLCRQATPPLVGSLIACARHSCRYCGRTVCDDCSTLPLKSEPDESRSSAERPGIPSASIRAVSPKGAARSPRICRLCYLGREHADAAAAAGVPPPREKFVFLVRHAQSTWNANVDLMKGCSAWTWRSLGCSGMSGSSSWAPGSFAPPERPERSVKDVMAQAASLVAHDVWNRDHPISREGLRQTEALRGKIASRREECTGPVEQCHAEVMDNSVAAGERERRYYDTFLGSRRRCIYSSPHLRALQTAHLVLPEEDGWGSITLLKEARECFRFKFERDCLGAGVGGSIVDRAGLHLGTDAHLASLQSRVDACDCEKQWWSEEPETEGDLEARLEVLWRRLLDEDGEDSCVLVTHSNLIKALLMRFGGVGDCETLAATDAGGGEGCGDASSTHDDGTVLLEDVEEEASWQVVHDGPEALRQLKVRRLQNCGVLGLRCVLEAPSLGPTSTVDGWIDISTFHHAEAGGHDGNAVSIIPSRCGEPQWVAKDALLMFDSILVQ